MASLFFVNRFFAPDHSATSQLLSGLGFHLAKTGASVHVITGRQVYDNSNAALPSNDVICGVCTIRVWTTRFGRQRLLGRTLDYLTFYFSAAQTLFCLLRSGDIVVAKTDPPLISVVAAVVAGFRGAKLINWIQDLFPEVAGALNVSGTGLMKGTLQAMRNWSLRRAVLNVVIGDRMAKRIAGEKVRPDRIRVIHNWADGDAVHPVNREENELRREWHLQDAFVVGYSGNIGRAHEFQTILAAAQELRDANNITFLFIGGGAQRDHIADEARSRGLKNVLFKPYQPRERLAVSLSVPDVHLVSLLPSLEGLIVPSKFYGIAAAGRPTLYVGDSEGEIPQFLTEFECGYTVAIGDSSDLARRIRQMSQNEESTLMGIRARAGFERLFDQKHAFAAWEQAIREASAV